MAKKKKLEGEITINSQGIAQLEDPSTKALPAESKEFLTNAKFIKDRIQQLKLAREKAWEEKDIADLWKKLDRMYVPHEFLGTGLQQWQSRNSQPMPYSKVQSAVSIVTRQNIDIIPVPGSKEYEPKNEFIKGLASKIRELGDQRGQWAIFELSRATKGFAVGRAYHRVVKRVIQDIESYDPQTGVTTYETKEHYDFNDPYFEAMSSMILALK